MVNLTTRTAVLSGLAALAATTTASPILTTSNTNTTTNGTAPAQPPVITLSPSGLELHGTINTTRSPSVAQYLGIPYAAPPTGARRFAPPEPFASLVDTTVVDASRPAKSCWQHVSAAPGILRTDAPEFMIADAADNMSEDCLSVSVWAPVNGTRLVGGTEEEGAKGLLPVVVWFYGGGFATGGTDVPYQLPDRWVERSGEHLVVAFNYRLNIFGFPNAAGLDEKKQNVGLMDQRFAVEWIRDNIAAFGGDPEQMVIWGQSAGAVAVDYYNFAYPSDPIVKGLIMDSGTAHLDQLTSWDLGHTNFTAVAQGLGCGANQTAAAELACMREAPASKIANFIAEYQDSTATNKKTLSFSPRADNVVVFGNYTERIKDSDLVSGLPAVIGFNRNEGAFLADYDAVAGPDAATVASLGYEYFYCPATKTSLERDDAGLATHRYYYAGNFSNVSPLWFDGAYHSSELPQIFGTAGDFRGESTTFEEEVGQAMQDAWLAFAKDPKKGLDGVEWPKWKGLGGDVRQFAVGDVVAQTGDAVTFEEECQRRGLL
ncbi:chlorogenic acid esterase precursor [Diplodia corticola]|uniref:Carboxylic ester hydrolase n=1 Tax=Diplodia corticola TaxID=236234 RepID=A0A1J9RPE3_9PEZI|nr:chlorogenic acid esterase precursor [Diplodia corticola]OJD30335.1 chlorogenic acid esterase precursor [Diplodia corticola]